MPAIVALSSVSHFISVISGVVTVMLSLAGIRVGLRVGMLFGNRMEILGGAILIAIGLRILLSHLLA